MVGNAFYDIGFSNSIYTKEYSDINHGNSRNCGEQLRSDAKGREHGIEGACKDEGDSTVPKEQTMAGMRDASNA